MKKSRILAVLAGSVLLMAIYAVAVPAQQGAAPVAGTRSGGEIALIDIGVIFKNHTRFKQHMADLQADMERAQQQMKSEGESLRKLRERLNEFRAGTPDYKQLEEEITKRSADLSARFQLQKNEFAKTEAKTYYMVYQEIQQEVDALAQANGIAVVLKFNSEEADPNKPDEVLRDLNKPVIWYARNLDITPVVLDSLNRRALQTDRSAAPGPVRLPQRR